MRSPGPHTWAHAVDWEPTHTQPLAYTCRTCPSALICCMYLGPGDARKLSPALTHARSARAEGQPACVCLALTCTRAKGRELARASPVPSQSNDECQNDTNVERQTVLMFDIRHPPGPHTCACHGFGAGLHTSPLAS